MRKRLLMGAGYAAFGIATFLIFLMFNLPFDRIRSVAEVQASQALGLKVEIDELSHSLFTGLHAEGVKLDMGSGEDGKALKPLRIDSLDLDLSFVRLIFGSVDADFETDLIGGHMEGDVELKNLKGIDADIEFEDVDLAALELTRKALNMGLKGKLSGTLHLEQEPDEPETLSGELNLKFTNLFLSKFAIKDKSGMTMLEWPDTRLGQLTAKVTVKSPKRRRAPRSSSEKGGSPTKLTAVAIEFVDFSGKGQDVDQLSVTGDLELNLLRPASSFISGTLSLQPNRKWLEDNHLNVLFDNLKEFKDARSGEKYSWRLSGPLSKPRLLPSRGVGNAVSSPPPKIPPKKPRPVDDPPTDLDIDDEDPAEPEPPASPLPTLPDGDEGP